LRKTMARRANFMTPNYRGIKKNRTALFAARLGRV
jgi:hypothetical protein